MELGYDSISQFLNFIFPFLMSRIINASSKCEGLILTYPNLVAYIPVCFLLMWVNIASSVDDIIHEQIESVYPF